MSYKFLSAGLRPTAEHAKKYFKATLGISTFRVEEQVSPEIAYVPTLIAADKDHYFICIEVSESAWPQNNQLDAFVLDCKNTCLPVKLYVVTPKGAVDSEFQKKMQRAKKNGVGVLEVDQAGGNLYTGALPLSLTGLIPFNPLEFPAKFRSAIHKAEETFCNGNPNKGCSALYDEIELLTRKLAIKTKKKGYWNTPAPGTKPSKLNLAKGAWAKIIELFIDNINLGVCKCPDLDHPLLHRVAGITPHRNDSGHKPKTQKKLRTRDQQLRTRFESARDLFKDLIDATKPLHL